MLATFFLNTKILLYLDNVYHLEKEHTNEKALMEMFENNENHKMLTAYTVYLG